MKKAKLQVVYFMRTKYNTMKKYVEVMSESEYLDLCLEDVVIKRKMWIA